LSNLFRRAMQYMLWVFTAAIFQSLVRRAGSECARPDGDLLACNDIGREGDSMLSLTLIFSNFD
jgi:hypothetical protein